MLKNYSYNLEISIPPLLHHYMIFYFNNVGIKCSRHILECFIIILIMEHTKFKALNYNDYNIPRYKRYMGKCITCAAENKRNFTKNKRIILQFYNLKLNNRKILKNT